VRQKALLLAWCSGSFVLGGLVTMLSAHFALKEKQPAGINGEGVSRGAWGNLEELEIPLSDRADLSVDRAVLLRPTSWFFENYTKDQLETLLRGCDLTPDQWGMLQRTNVVTVAPNGIVLAPPDDFVWSLGAAARAKIYEVLAQTGRNLSQKFPFCFTPERFSERLAQSGIEPNKQARIASLAYTNHGFIWFSDLQLLPGILSSNELDGVSEALYCVPTYRLRLRIYSDSDAETIVKYWGGQDRERRIRPLLESLTRVRGRTNGVSLNISYLLPPTARLRLYTYPNSWPNAEAERQDCFWTALNFSCDPPDPRYLDSQRNDEFLSSEYHLIETAPTFGDLIVLVGPKGNALHAAVYIADDFVFTKNGVNALQPWVLMKMSDMLAVFSIQHPARTAILRRNQTPGAVSAAAAAMAKPPVSQRQ
jgi:hypothetical protein